MSVQGIPNLKASGVPEDTSRSKRWRDLLLKDVPNSGVRFEFDLAFPFSYPGGSPMGRAAATTPIAGQAITDVAEIANGTIGVGTAGTLAYTGGGFDFTNDASVTAVDRGVIAPASVMADLFTPYNGAKQQFLICAYLKLPTLANWTTYSGITAILGDKNYASAAALGSLGFFTGGAFQWRRQTSLGSYDTTSGFQIAPAAADYGTIVQLAIWRNAAGQGLRIKSTNGTQLATRAMGADNTADPSANTLCFGRNAASFGGQSPSTTLATFSGYRIYRGFVENLARSGRVPATVLDADYTRTMARGVFS